MSHKFRARVESPRLAAVAPALCPRLYQFSQISGNRVNASRANLRANGFIVVFHLLEDFWIVEIEFGGRMQHRMQLLRAFINAADDDHAAEFIVKVAVFELAG